ncbi:MAG TPA: alkaline phosphatase D family protein [Burkholderiales bacterium]|nr:alkaline phosphatase D family protein [Burkholderiales bacterium]
MFDRRRFLQYVAALGVLPSLPARAQVLANPRFTADPFSLGVASGYPRPDGMVLWTRLMADLGPATVPVRWEIGADDGMRKIVAAGSAGSGPEWAHSVHVEAKGLEPDRWYWYRFRAGDALSPIGRTRTAPLAQAAPGRLRFAFASCQQYEQGWFTAYRHMAGDELDLVAFLGDYIYESSWGQDHVRKHDAAEPYTLAEYRARYALYKADPDLQKAHHACPWIFTWDDHEVDNDYADDRPEDGMPREQFLLRRAAAYRAYYEHMPLPSSMRPNGPDMRIYTAVNWGRLANFIIIDDRQYRAYQVCPSKPGGSTVIDPETCQAVADPSRTMLGAAQEAWLDRAFAESKADWNILTQQTLMAQLDRKVGEGRQYWTDGWDGYPAARRKLLESMAAKRLANPVVIGGDVHMHWVADLKPDFDDPKSPVVASELCGTSITSQGPSQSAVDALLPENPHMKYGRSDRRGYVRASIAGGRLDADVIGLDTVKKSESRAEVLTRFVVENGKPGPQLG